MKQRVLYLDVPFENESGGDKNRSRFLWQTLRTRYQADLVLLGREGAGPRPMWTHFKPRAVLAPQPSRFPRPASTPAFLPSDHALFSELLRDGKYDLILSRFCTGWELCQRAGQTAPDTRVVVDVDMLSSRLVALAWRAQPTLSRRWFLFEKWKLQRFEKRLFREPWLFLFTNGTELAQVRDQIAPHPASGEFTLVPNTMPQATELQDVQRKPVILFFGSMDSAANADAFAFLLDEVIPEIKSHLRQHGVEVHIVGKNPPAQFHDRLMRSGMPSVKIIGGVESIERAIAESLFVLLPLRVASGTRTRILEAAAQRRAVITTSIGAEGLDLGDTLLIGEKAGDLAAHTQRLLEHPEQADVLGRRLQEQAFSLYTADRVASDLVQVLKRFAIRQQEGQQ
jgi:glycosyltransferase involved in cell wall biosynthesis